MKETKLIRRPRVEELTGLKKSAIYEKVKNGTLPAPYRIGSRAVAWRSDEIQNWIEERPKVERWEVD